MGLPEQVPQQVPQQVPNSYLIILPNKKSVLYLQLRNGCFGNGRFGTKLKVYEIF